MTVDVGEAAACNGARRPCRYIKVDEYSKTNIDNIYAVGDITDRMALTPVALMEGGAVAHTLFNDTPTKPDHKFIPTAVFSQPHIGTCGYTESEAVEEFKDVDVFTSAFKPMRSGFIGKEQRGYYKIIVDAATDKVVGMHMLGPDSGEIMQARRAALLARLPATCARAHCTRSCLGVGCADKAHPAYRASVWQ